jgi:arabinofuranosyltransferase
VRVGDEGSAVTAEQPQPAPREKSGGTRVAGLPAWAICALGLTVFTAVFANLAWASEDAYITFRTIEQLFAGNGLRWNPHERVQTFTHPLWLLLLSALRIFSGDVYLNAVAASYACCLTALLVLWRCLASPIRWAALLILLLSSKSFMDYTSSGLENPLVYALLALFLTFLFRLFEGGAPGERDVLGLAASTGLLLTCRHDVLTLVGVPFATALWRSRALGWGRLAGVVAAGLSPFALWTAFSLVYYGFPFPNTAYAKLNTGMAAAALSLQGIGYLRSFVRFDPLALVLVGSGLAMGIRRSRPWSAALAVGLALNLLYVVRVGGDFMAGRFLSSAVLVSAVAVVRGVREERRLLAGAAVAGVLMLLSPLAPLRSGPFYRNGEVDAFHISDERGIFHKASSLYRWLATDPGETFPVHRWSQSGREFARSPERVMLRANIGYFGYWAGTDKILVDPLAIADPLLARLPMQEGWWRIGHFPRAIPGGYLESLRTGRNQLEDTGLREFYRQLRLVTSGPLVDTRRLRAIWDLNRGRYEDLLPTDLREGLETPPGSGGRAATMAR